MAKLWQKNYALNELIEKFTVGEDYLLDIRLLKADCLASMAHAVMLQEAGLLTAEEASGLRKGLAAIIERADRGDFPIRPQDEDSHTAIEGYLTENIGEAGKKIHTGRSRNDQVLASTRLYGRGAVLRILESGLRTAESWLQFAAANRDVPMPGRTHMQIAMPSSLGLWGGAWAEALLDDLKALWFAYDRLNSSPLGSAASYGVPLPLNRERTAELLGFARVQNNVLYVNNSRGKLEAFVMDALEHAGISLSKMAQDLILYSMPEFGYFQLPDELCSGSSIMPQKKNPDGLELMRARAASLSAWNMQVKALIRSAPSGYNRDYQDTKGPFLRALDSAYLCLEVMALTVEKLRVDKERLAAGFTPDIYATDAALARVSGGESFRDAYRYVGTHLNELGQWSPAEALKNRTYTGTTGNLNLEPARRDLGELKAAVRRESSALKGALESLAGRSVSLF